MHYTFTLSAGMSAADAAIQRKIYGWGSPWCTAALLISNGEIGDIMKIVKPLEEPRLLVKEIDKAIQNKTKDQKKTSSNAVRNISF